MRRSANAILTFVCLLMTLAIDTPVAAALACSVSGTAHDSVGAAVPSVAVKIIPVGAGTPIDLATDAAGHYCAYSLPPGKYTITFSQSGFLFTTIGAITITANHTTQADVTMSPIRPQPQSHIPSVSSHAPSPQRPGGGSPAPANPAPRPGPSIHHHHAAASHGSSQNSTQASSHHSTQIPDKSPTLDPNLDPNHDLGQAEAQWFSQLPNGYIQYTVPATMTIGRGSTVTVTVSGYKAPEPTTATGSAPAPLKVAEWMRVEVTQPNNPDEFTITSDPSQNPKFVPIDAGATWTWTVTPNHIAKNQQLQFQASVLYGSDTSKVQQALPSYRTTVTVQAEGVSGLVKNAEDNFWLEPSNWFKFILPGGGGFILIGLIINWLRNRNKKPQEKH